MLWMNEKDYKLLLRLHRGDEVWIRRFKQAYGFVPYIELPKARWCKYLHMRDKANDALR